MAEYISVATKFFEDSFIQQLPPTDKLLYLYLFAGPQAEPTLGIYELSLRTMAHHTGLTEANIRDSLNRFAQAGKVHHVDDWIILKKHFKHNPLRGNQRLITGALRRFENVPWQIRERIVDPTDTLYIAYLDPTHSLYIAPEPSREGSTRPVPALSRPVTTLPYPVPALSRPGGGGDDKSSGGVEKGKGHLEDAIQKLANQRKM